MVNNISAFFPVLFLPLFAGFWLLVTTVLMTLAGWFDLARTYPDRADPALLKLRFQSGRMGSFLGGVSMSGILRLEACDAGLRVGIWKLFGPFCRDFFVPWSEIQIHRKRWIAWNVANLEFGVTGNLELFDYTANRIWRAVPQYWPEDGSIPVETHTQAFGEAFKLWLLGTILAGSFFAIVPRLISPEETFPPLAVAIGFPAVIFGLAALGNFFRRIKR